MIPESVMRFSMLLVSEMATLVGKSDEVREDHPSIKDMKKRLNRICFDVLFAVVVQPSLDGVLEVSEGEHRFDVSRDLGHLLSPDLVVKSPQRH